MSVILATQEADIRRTVVQSHPGQQTYHKKGLAEWRKVKALNSNPGTSIIIIILIYRIFERNKN
jgi:hypothetical protein